LERAIRQAFRILPVYGSTVFTWRVILRDHEAERNAPAAYTSRGSTGPPPPQGSLTANGRTWTQAATRGSGPNWTTAALTFARMVKLDAAPHDED
jgi:hypothetical protein